MVVFLRQAVPAGEGAFGGQLAAELAPLDPDHDPHVLVRIVAEAVVHVVVADGGAGAEGDAPPVVREEGVRMVVQFRDGQGAVQDQPVDHVGHLAEAAAVIGSHAAFRDDKALFVAFPAGGAPHGAPEGKGLSRSHRQAVDFSAGQGDIGDFVFLQRHIHAVQPAEQQGGMAFDQAGERGLFPAGGETLSGEEIPHVPEEDLFLRGDGIGKRAYLTEQLSCHIASGDQSSPVKSLTTLP